MIADRNIAQHLSQILLDVSGRVDESVAMVQAQCSETELNLYRRAAGKIMGAILTEVLNPLFTLHPDIAPAEMREFYANR